MPTYDYRCPNGHDFEHFFRKISDATAELVCPTCGAVAQRRVSGGAGLVFKGSGFYLTDYGKNAHRKGSSAGSSESNSESSSVESKSSSKPEPTKSESGSSTTKGDSAGSARSESSKGTESTTPATKTKGGDSK